MNLFFKTNLHMFTCLVTKLNHEVTWNIIESEVYIHTIYDLLSRLTTICAGSPRRLHCLSHWQVSFTVHIFRANMSNIFFHECRLASRCNNSRSKLASLNRQKGRMEQKEEYLVTIVHTFILIKCLN